MKGWMFILVVIGKDQVLSLFIQSTSSMLRFFIFVMRIFAYYHVAITNAFLHRAAEGFTRSMTPHKMHWSTGKDLGS